MELPQKLKDDLKHPVKFTILVILVCFVVMVIGSIVWSVYAYEIRKDYTVCGEQFSFNDLRDSYYRAHPEITWDNLVKLNVTAYIDDYQERYCKTAGT